MPGRWQVHQVVESTQAITWHLITDGVRCPRTKLFFWATPFFSPWQIQQSSFLVIKRLQ